MYYKAFAFAIVASILETTLAVKPVFSRSRRPAMVVPPGLEILSNQIVWAVRTLKKIFSTSKDCLCHDV